MRCHLFIPVMKYAAFFKSVEYFFAKLRSNTEQNRTLAETRDYLLPKLMSGEVRVSDAEDLIREAAE